MHQVAAETTANDCTERLAIGRLSFMMMQADGSFRQAISVAVMPENATWQSYSWTEWRATPAVGMGLGTGLLCPREFRAVNGYYSGYDPTRNVFALLNEDAPRWSGWLGGSPTRLLKRNSTIPGVRSGWTKVGADLAFAIDKSLPRFVEKMGTVDFRATGRAGAASGWRQVVSNRKTVHPQVVDVMTLNRGDGRQGFVALTSAVSNRDGAATIPSTPLVMNMGVHPANARFLPYARAFHGCFLSTEDVSGWFGHRGDSAGQKADRQHLPRLAVNFNLQLRRGFAGSRQNHLAPGGIPSCIEMGAGTESALMRSRSGAVQGPDEPGGSAFEFPRRYRVAQLGDGFLVGVAGEHVASPGVTQQLRPDREVTR